ncbi:MAG: hypothetical protein CL670_08285 [Balneola sp.]|jgi:hypothetical protein|nr:hypothetical protein [Balneola sp.]MBE79135.1 hypothetical protein [Balneola sp.]|tara:strand:+ start:317 stop:724 length:408 start_codon:yes stop_codon:yes gene_type:complete
MGINSTFQSFVHSEVKTSYGFRLVEAYLTYRDLGTNVKDQSAETASYEEVDYSIKDKHETQPSSSKDFSSDFFGKRVSFISQSSGSEYVKSDSHEISPEKLSDFILSDKLLKKRNNFYQGSSDFTAKGTLLDMQL